MTTKPSLPCLALFFWGLLVGCAGLTPAQQTHSAKPLIQRTGDRFDVPQPLETAVQPLTSPAKAKVLPPNDKMATPLERTIIDDSPAVRCAVSHPNAVLQIDRKDEWPRGEVVLTFDDGPHPTITPRVLDLLARYDMPATIFVVGRAINRKTYHLVQRMVAEGHTLGSHTYNHDVEMATRVEGERTIAYIRGQHEVTRMLIDLSLLASSADDFDRLYRRVFDHDPLVYLSSSSLRSDWRTYAQRHDAVIAEHGFGVGEHVYPVMYSRPPGGGPYMGTSPHWSAQQHDEALRQLGMINVMWHGGAGDTDPSRRSDFGFLYGNIQHNARRGGVLLIHDYIRNDALAAALKFMVDNDIHVATMDEVVERKYGCAAWALRDRIARAQ